MVNPIHSHDWYLIGKRVTGAAHLNQNQPCQDRHKFHKGNGIAIMAVADGHGSPKSPYSDKGAELAVEVAIETCLDFFEKMRNSGPSLSAVKRYAEEELPKLIVKGWVQRVEDHYRNQNPQTDPTLGGQSLLILYGTTLLVALLEETYAIFLQLGDGDILLVDDDGSVYTPLPPDERLMGNETTSLCSPQAWKEMRTVFLSHRESLPALILLSTDGYSNSFKSREDFLQVGRDYWFIKQKHGIRLIEESLEEWLTEVSVRGCGDDIAVCMAFRSTNHSKNNDEAIPDGPGEFTDNHSSTDIQQIRE